MLKFRYNLAVLQGYISHNEYNKMILIISSSGHTVNEVMDWLNHYGYSFIRVSDLDNLFEIAQLSISDSEVVIKLKNENFEVDLRDIRATWVWHGHVVLSGLTEDNIKNMSVIKGVTDLLLSQKKILEGYIMTYLLSKPIIGNPYRQNANKLTMLRYANEVGLKVPETHVVSSVNEVLEIGKNKKLITKSISEVATLFDKDNTQLVEGYTIEVEADILIKMTDKHFFPSLIQEKIEKRYEVRIFFLFGKCYPMAILSQRDPQTSLDFRRYNQVIPNRMMGCCIPQELDDKIIKFMELAGHNCGSLDFIKSQEGEYIFLEVNPVGQFGFVSTNCNYGIEKLIAEKLISLCEQ